MASRKRNVIWEYLAVYPEDERTTICNTCDEAISLSRSGVNARIIMQVISFEVRVIGQV